MDINKILIMMKQIISKPEGIISGLICAFIVWLLGKFFSKLKIIYTKVFIENPPKNEYKELIKELGIEETMKTKFPSYHNNYLLVQYGSSTQYDKIPHDKDYIVLMLGYEESDVRHLHNKGTNEYSNSYNGKNKIDIVYRDYFSFLFASCAGMPYENSVIQSGNLLCGEKGYFTWLKSITKNILIDKGFLCRRFQEKICIEREEYDKAVKEHKDYRHDKYYIIRAGYYLASSIFQYVSIKKMKDTLTVNDIVPLADVRMFYKDEKLISNDSIMDKYKALVETLKRNNESDDYELEDIENILEYAYALISGDDIKFNLKGKNRLFSFISLKTSFYEELQKNEWAKIEDEPISMLDNINSKNRN